jgi:hypothetical protein
MGLEPLDHSLLAVTGYTDRLSPRAGESVTVHASSVHPEGTLRLVRLGHDGTTFTKDEVTPAAPLALAHRDRSLGSYGIVEGVAVPGGPATVRAWVWLSLLPKRRDAALVGVIDLGLTLDASGAVTLTAGDTYVTSSVKLERRRWTEVSGGVRA